MSRYQVGVSLRPETLAAIYVEAGAFLPEDILIRTKRGRHHGYAREVLEAKKTQGGRLEIVEKQKCQLQQEMEKEYKKKDPLWQLLAVIEEELAFFRIRLELRDREMVLSSNETYGECWQLSEELTPGQKTRLAYFMPFLEAIRGDLLLTECCFSAALDCPVKIEKAEPKLWAVPERELTFLENWQLGVNSILGGTTCRKATHVQLFVGPIKPEALEDWLPGYTQRNFLEKGLCPQFLPEGWDWTVVLIPDESYAEWSLSEDGFAGRLGLTTTLS